MRLAGLVLIVLGVLAVVYGGFSYSTNDTKAELGPVTVKVEERERVNVPMWAGVVAIAAGAVLVFKSKGAALS
jgi:drug/metabolite transporter (DMT)-like permease